MGEEGGGVRIKVMRTRVSLKAAAEDKYILYGISVLRYFYCGHTAKIFLIKY